MSNIEFASKQEFKAFLAGLIRQPDPLVTPKTTETETQIITETNTQSATLSKIKFTTSQESRDFEIELKERIIRGTTKMTLGDTPISFIDKNIIEAPELDSDMIKWIYHKQMRGMLEIEQ